MTGRRIQLTRRRPWRGEHPDAIRVDRATRWGNPFPVAERGSRTAAVAAYRHALLAGELPGIGRHQPVTVATVRAELAGADLACWCPLDGQCHAEVLLAVADGRS
jgi:hypothetical protein